MRLSGRDGVALLAEGVDRNTSKARVLMGNCYVALLAEGVDRNHKYLSPFNPAEDVALLAEGVDRNMLTGGKMPSEKESPSSRRAWIEMPSIRT